MKPVVAHVIAKVRVTSRTQAPERKKKRTEVVRISRAAAATVRSKRAYAARKVMSTDPTPLTKLGKRAAQFPRPKVVKERSVIQK
jgi:hypothetical protein